MPVNNTIAMRLGAMTQWRRHLHAHPELGFEEYKTADFIAEKLESFGVEVHRGLAGTGVVGVIAGKQRGAGRIGLRADIDALPMAEDNSFAHASTIEGVMHGCGHDGHTAMLLAAAQYLAETRNFSGEVVVIFQPAEEGGGGGRVMVEEGLFDRFPIDTVWGLHNWPGLGLGKAIIQRGVSMAAADTFTLTVTGTGGHAAMPHLATDSIIAGSAIVGACQTLIARFVNPLDSAVLSITQFHAGSTHNVIPEVAVIEGTARYIAKATGVLLRDKLAQMASKIAEAYGCTARLDWHQGYPPTINHESEALRAAAVAETVLGADSVLLDAPPSMGAEDFSYMLEAKPGAYIWLGAGEGAMLHNTHYDFNDELLPLGASYWVALAERELPLES